MSCFPLFSVGRKAVTHMQCLHIIIYMSYDYVSQIPCCTSKPSVLEAIWLNKLHVNIDITAHGTWHQKDLNKRWFHLRAKMNLTRFAEEWDVLKILLLLGLQASKRSQIVRPIWTNMLCIQVDLWILLVARNFQLLDCMWLHFGSHTSWSLHAGMYLACVHRVECV